MEKNNTIRLDFLFRIIALLSAILLWLFVIHIENPIYSTSIKNHPVSLLNIERVSNEGFSVKNKKELIDLVSKISLKGPRLKIEEILDNPNLLNAFIDFSRTTIDPNLDNQVIYLNVNTTVSVSGVTVESIKDKSVEIELEKIVSKEFPIEINTSLKENEEYLTLTPIFSQSSVTLTGPISEIEKVTLVVANVTIDDFSGKAISIDAPLIALDDKGNACEDVFLSTNSVNIVLPIGKKKEVPVNVVINENSISSNVSIIDISLSTNVITIVGEPELIDTIDVVDLNEISLTGVEEDTSMYSVINLPAGVTRIDSLSNFINVNLKIEKHQSFESKLSIKNSNLSVVGIKDQNKYKILTKQITIPFYAAPSISDKVDINTFKFYIDLSGLEKGIYTVSARTTSTLPIKLISDTTYIQVEIL